MRIVHVCRVAPPSTGGMEAVVDGLSAVQRAGGHDVRIVTATSAPGRWWTPSGVPVVGLRRVGSVRWPRAEGLARALEGADLVHVHGIDGLTDQVLSLRRRGTAVGVSTHGGFLHTDRQRWLKQLWLRTGTRWSLGRADAIWFTSAADRRALAPAGRDGEVVPDGVDTVGFSARPRQPETGHWVVPGRVDVHKGLDRLIDTLRVLVDRDSRPFTVHVVGAVSDPALAADLGVRAASLGGRWQLHGRVSRSVLVDHLSRCELALFPSRHEGFGLAVVEAMAAGVAPVVQPIPAFLEHVTPGEDGSVVDFGDPQRAAGALSSLRDRPRGPLDAAAPRAAARWSWEAVAPRWERAYRDALEAACG